MGGINSQFHRQERRSMRNTPLLLAVCLSIAGCAMPRSRDEMLASATGLNRVCSGEFSPAEATQRLRSAWATCFVNPPGVKVIPLGRTVVAHERSRVIITNEQLGAASIIIARLAPPPSGMMTPLSHSVFLMADIRETNECRSEVVVRAANSHWEKRARQTAAWLANPAAISAEAACDR